jgi:hypothetical protein
MPVTANFAMLGAMHEVKVVATILATAIALVAYVPYLVDMFRGKNQPHLYTWISITLITAVVAYLQLIGGAGLGAIPVVLGVGVDVIILFYCFRFGTKDVVFMDKVCLAISIVGVLTYAILSSKPLISLILVSIAEVTSFIPTVRKTRNDPYSESLTSYYLLLGKLSFILIALEKYNALTVSYPTMWIVVFVAFLIATYIWRAKSHRHKPSPHSAAPIV